MSCFPLEYRQKSRALLTEGSRHRAVLQTTGLMENERCANRGGWGEIPRKLKLLFSRLLRKAQLPRNGVPTLEKRTA